MSWSLQLSNGDFSTRGAQLATVQDASKLLQDMRCLVLEPMGTDAMHPDYGSLIDGANTPNGTVVAPIIGTEANVASIRLQSEFQRLSTYYRSLQLNRAKNDRIAYNRVTLTAAEVLLALTITNLHALSDTLLVTATLQTAAGQDVSLALGLTANS